MPGPVLNSDPGLPRRNTKIDPCDRCGRSGIEPGWGYPPEPCEDCCGYRKVDRAEVGPRWSDWGSK